MGAFNTKKYLNGNPSLIPQIASRIENVFSAEGYNVQTQSLMSGGADISLAKGGVFKAVLGLKTALKITLKPEGEGINFEAGVGLFGMQIIPTAVMWFIAWPVLVTQIWGLVQQSKLDDRVLKVAEDVISENAMGKSAPAPTSFMSAPEKKFCTKCGAELPAEALFCPKCGAQQ